HTLQPAAMDGKLRHLMAGIEAALLMPDLLAMPRQIEQLIGANRDLVEPIQKANACQLTDRVRQRIDANTELADGIRLLKQLAIDATRPQHERCGEATDTAADADRFHGPNSTQPRMQPDCR